MSTWCRNRRNALVAALACALSAASSQQLKAGIITWDNGGGDNAWSTTNNWSGTPDNTEPTLADDTVFTTTGAGTLVLSAGETANSLSFNSGAYTLGSVGVGDITLGNPGQTSAGAISVANTLTATINSTLTGASGLTKSGAGTLTLGGANLVVGGITISGGTLAAGVVAFGNNAINVSSVGNLDLRGGIRYLRELSGAGTIWAGHTDMQVLNVLNDATFSGTITHSWLPNGIEFAHIVKTGPGSQTIDATVKSYYQYDGLELWRGTLAYAGANGRIVDSVVNGARMRGATLTLDDSAVDIDRLEDTTTVVVYGGGSTLRYIGSASADTAETVGALGGPGINDYGTSVTIDVRPGSSRNAALTFASYGFLGGDGWQGPAAAIANFSTGAGNTFGSDAKVLFTTAPTLRNGVLQSGIVNGVDFATYESTTLKGVMTFGTAGSGTSYVNPTDVNTPATTDTVLIDSNTTTTTLTASKGYSALKIDGTRTIALGGNTLNVGQTAALGYLGAMVLKTGAGQAEISSTAVGGVADSGWTANYMFYVNAGTLKVTARLLCGSSGSKLRVNKAGPGLLWLDPVANWSGAGGGYGSAIYFSEGAIRLDPDSGRFGNQPMVLDGGVMEIAGGGTYAPTIGTGNANLRWQSSGGFAAYGVDATFSPAITWNAANHIPDGAALLLNSTTADSKITLSGILNLGTDAAKMYLREIEVADNPGASTDLAEINGQMISDNVDTPTYTYHLVKTGAGTLILSHANNTYSGATYVKAGTLLVNGTLATSASSTVTLNPDYSAVTVMNGGTLGGTGTIARKVIVQAGGTLAPGESVGELRAGHLALQAGANVKIEFDGAAADKLTVTGTVALGGATLTVTASSAPTAREYVLIANDGTDAVTGTFAGLAEGGKLTVGSAEYQVTYKGGDGNNDVVLRRKTVGGTIFIR